MESSESSTDPLCTVPLASGVVEVVVVVGVGVEGVVNENLRIGTGCTPTSPLFPSCCCCFRCGTGDDVTFTGITGSSSSSFVAVVSFASLVSFVVSIGGVEPVGAEDPSSSESGGAAAERGVEKGGVLCFGTVPSLGASVSPSSSDFSSCYRV